MAAHWLACEVADLCLGKPLLRSISASSTISEALAEIKASEGNCISIWSCDYNEINSNNLMNDEKKDCICIGKLCMVDVICYLCKEDNFCSPSLSLKAPVSTLLPKLTCFVKHVEPSTSLLEATDIMLQGVHNIVIPIKSKVSSNSRRKQFQKSSSCTQTNHNGIEFCWLAQEDVIRFLLNSIGFFSPIPTLSIEDLDIIATDILAIGYNSLASSAVEAISCSLSRQTSVAVVDDCGTLIGEISPSTLACGDETISAAIMTLSAGDLIAYIDCGSPAEEIMNVAKSRLKDMNLEGILEEFEVGDSNSTASFSSSDEELPSPKTTLISPKPVSRHGRSSSYSARMLRTAEAIVCHPWSSLVAVMIQAIAHRLNYVWVIEEDYSVVGIVTFASILGILRDYFESLLCRISPTTSVLFSSLSLDSKSLQHRTLFSFGGLFLVVLLV
ncbi:kinase modulator [Lithospermum erythrorhizon]|uniref:Kinase modulator n=1 Tax=Lithospermum erythrorhizon TaxID=34254 RepID=A0AAV3RLK9_LITER